MSNSLHVARANGRGLFARIQNLEIILDYCHVQSLTFLALL